LLRCVRPRRAGPRSPPRGARRGSGRALVLRRGPGRDLRQRSQAETSGRDLRQGDSRRGKEVPGGVRGKRQTEVTRIRVSPRSTNEPGFTCRPRLRSTSPSTLTSPFSMRDLACAPSSTTPASFSSWPSRIISPVIGTLMASFTWLMSELMSLSRCYWLIAAAFAREGSARGGQDRRVRNRSGLSSRRQDWRVRNRSGVSSRQA
jgi:hypothetical protein